MSSREARELWQDITAEPYVVIENLCKNYGPVVATKNLNLEIYKTELFALLGGSGCGKSTLLRMIAGLEQPDSGRIIIDGYDVTHLPAYKRPVNMMFQSYALFPHMNVWENIAFGLKQEQDLSVTERNNRIEEALDLVRMRSYAKRMPHQLSGGQRQRIALARSLAKRPKILLLDEPLTALDKKLREQTQFELVNIQEKVGVTCIMVTHDQEEAMTMSTRMGIMNDGEIKQIGTPREIYEFPNSRFVADFIGGINLFDGVVLEESKSHTLIESPDIPNDIRINHASSVPEGSNVHVGIRPEKIQICIKEKNTRAANTVSGIVKEIAYIGDMSIYHVKVESGAIIQASLPNMLRLSESDLTWDSEVLLSWQPENAIVLAQ